MKDWIDTTYRRSSVDMHVPDWDERLLANFDAGSFADNLKKSGAQSHLQMCNSVAGQALWQSKTARVHGNMGSRDFVAELLQACHARDIRFIAYFCLVWDCLSYELHPDWRVEVAPEMPGWKQSRMGLCCFNAPGYREYVLNCIGELAGNYDIDGMFLDMPSWILICRCPNCRKRFLAEYGRQIPEVIDWKDQCWRDFLEARERWCLEFTGACREAFKRLKPAGVFSMNHATIMQSWIQSAPMELARQCDYESGDFYGDPAIHSLACKVYRSISRHTFELATSRTRNHTNHLSMKTLPELRRDAYIATLNSGALLLIDYVNPDGTLNPDVYDFLGRLNRQRSEYEPWLGGNPVADVAVYFDHKSVIAPELNGEKLDSIEVGRLRPPGWNSIHQDAAVGASKRLQEAHIPYGVVTDINLEKLADFKTVILPHAVGMTPEEADLFRDYVRNGGTLYASGWSSWDHAASEKFLLADVFGVEYAGSAPDCYNYLTPVDPELRQAIAPQDHVCAVWPPVRLVKCVKARVLAEWTPPFVSPEIGRAVGQRFAGFHSNPPAMESSGIPAVTINNYGRGRAVYCGFPIEMDTVEEGARCFFEHLISRLLPPDSYSSFLEAHPALEMVVSDQPENHRLVAAVVNLMAPPPVPVGGRIRIRIPADCGVCGVRTVPGGESVPFTTETGGVIKFELSPVESFTMYEIAYERHS